MCSRDHLAQSLTGALEHRRGRIHVTRAVSECVDVVVIADGAVGRQSGVDRLVAAVHRNQVDVDVDEQVTVGGTLVDPDFLILAGLAEQDITLGIFSIMVIEPVREGAVENARAQPFFYFAGRHAAVQTEGSMR